MSVILGSNERPLATDLLRVTEVHDFYQDNAMSWESLIKTLRSTTSGVLRTQNGQPVEFEPREFLSIALPFLLPTIDPFTSEISGFEQSQVGDLKQLYRRLTSLKVGILEKPEEKALFLLLGKLSEERNIFNAV
jgi:hypothetical protein